ncbi:TetR/AcrR family transcriptional regulator [Loigolactobacillus binensis]|uniref:TetR/AcrR family transcriptional regulator n=1 Tax=Loigolactobacillus binensis TaxID=2559922 RepID=A0ABW3EG39_9LACO|nr:TetR/AcrR family transcriptional regulator [Loigolactobacillus binensis]
MRKKNPQNLIAIKNAVYDITINDGYQNLSMSKIAKQANVPQATIYLNYESKEKMLTSIYVETRDMLASHTKVVAKPPNVEKEIKRLFTNYCQALWDNPKQALFMNIINNTPELIETNVYQALTNRNHDIIDLIKYGQQIGQIENLTLDVIVAFTFNALNSLLEVTYTRNLNLTREQIEKATNLCWKVIKADQ